MSVFSERITMAMNERGLTCGQLAIRSGVCRQAIFRYRDGTREPSGRRLLLIADALGTDPWWLMGLKDEKK